MNRDLACFWLSVVGLLVLWALFSSSKSGPS